MNDEPRVITGKGTFRITIVNGGIEKFECWDQDEEGNTKAYFHAPPDTAVVKYPEAP